LKSRFSERGDFEMEIEGVAETDRENRSGGRRRKGEEGFSLKKTD
jgi:hypothetical protein